MTKDDKSWNDVFNTALKAAYTVGAGVIVREAMRPLNYFKDWSFYFSFFANKDGYYLKSAWSGGKTSQSIESSSGFRQNTIEDLENQIGLVKLLREAKTK